MRRYIVSCLGAFALGAGAMAFIDGSARAAPRADRETYDLLAMFGEALATVEREFVTPPNNRDLIETALGAMLASLDPHSAFLSAEDLADRDESGRLPGVGLMISGVDGDVRVISAVDGGAASDAGIRPGDQIIAIDGRSVGGESAIRLTKRLRGPDGSIVVLSIAREGGRPFDVQLTRGWVTIESVTSQTMGDYGYVRVASLEDGTGDKVAAAVRALQAANPAMKGLVLDLRDCPGGLLDQSVDVASRLLDGGVIVSQRGRDVRDVERYNARPGDQVTAAPMVVLVNERTASGAEIIAAALQDNGRAKLVGLPTFGMGSIQTVIPLNGGRNGALKLTTSFFSRPAGQPLQGVGVSPDLLVAPSQEVADRLASGKRGFSERDLPGALNLSTETSGPPARIVAEAPPAGYSGDFQLTRALAVLKAGAS